MTAALGLEPWCVNVAGIAFDFLGTLLLLWPVIRPGLRRFDTMDYVQSWQTRTAAGLLLLGFALQGIGTYMSGEQR